MKDFPKIGLINNTNKEFSLKNLDYFVINKTIHLKDFNKLDKYEDFDYLFLYDNDILYLKDFSINIPSIFVDFTSGSVDYRRKTSGKKQEILRAIGFEKNKNLKILDATAGLCKDSFIFATYGINVLAIEQNPLIYNITLNALENAKNDNEISNIVNNINLINANSVDFLKNNEDYFDCIYLDPMFPQKNKTSLCKKEMQIFHNLAFYGNNDELFELSMLKATNRVVVKRMLKSEYIIDKKPDYQILGKTIRYDIYLKK